MNKEANTSSSTINLPCKSSLAINGDAAGISSDVDHARILRKIDLRLLSLTCAGFFLLNLSRSSFANALEINNDVEGATMKEQLDIDDARYSRLIMIYTAVFIVFEIPSNLFLKYMSARHHLARIAVGWGIVGICGAAPTSYNGMLANRVFLAVTQAGYFPSIIYIIGNKWYSETERALRFALLTAMAMLSAAFSGLIATGCSYLNGKAQLAGWRWLFILTGIPSVLIGIAIFFVLPNDPESASFLTQEEKHAVLQKVKVQDKSAVDKEATSSSASKFNLNDVTTVLKDWSFWYMTLLYIIVVMSNKPVAFFLPSLVASLGDDFQGINTQLMTIPVTIFACVCTIVNGWASDKARNRPVFVMLGLVLVCVGYIMLVVIKKAVAGRFVAFFLCSLGPAAEIPTVAYALTIQHEKGWNPTSLKFGSSAIIALAVLGDIFAALITGAGLSSGAMSAVFLGLTAFGVALALLGWWLFGSGFSERMVETNEDAEHELVVKSSR